MRRRLLGPAPQVSTLLRPPKTRRGVPLPANINQLPGRTRPGGSLPGGHCTLVARGGSELGGSGKVVSPFHLGPRDASRRSPGGSTTGETPEGSRTPKTAVTWFPQPICAPGLSRQTPALPGVQRGNGLPEASPGCQTPRPVPPSPPNFVAASGSPQLRLSGLARAYGSAPSRPPPHLPGQVGALPYSPTLLRPPSPDGVAPSIPTQPDRGALGFGTALESLSPDGAQGKGLCQERCRFVQACPGPLVAPWGWWGELIPQKAAATLDPRPCASFQPQEVWKNTCLAP